MCVSSTSSIFRHFCKLVMKLKKKKANKRWSPVQIRNQLVARRENEKKVCHSKLKWLYISFGQCHQFAYIKCKKLDIYYNLPNMLYFVCFLLWFPCNQLLWSVFMWFQTTREMEITRLLHGWRGHVIIMTYIT